MGRQDTRSASLIDSLADQPCGRCDKGIVWHRTSDDEPLLKKAHVDCEGTGLRFPWVSRVCPCLMNQRAPTRTSDLPWCSNCSRSYAHLTGCVCQGTGRVPLSEAELQAALIAQPSFVVLIRQQDGCLEACFYVNGRLVDWNAHIALSALVAAFAEAEGVKVPDADH